MWAGRALDRKLLPLSNPPKMNPLVLTIEDRSKGYGNKEAEGGPSAS
jgi:hypothetical protein